MLPEIAIIAGIVAGVAALIAIGVLLYKNWDTISAVAGKVWSAIQGAAESAFSWFKSNWPLLVGILAGPFGLALALIITHWTAIRNAIASALNAIRSAITTAFNAVVSIVTAAMNALVSAIRGAIGLAIAAANAIATGVRNVFSGAIGWLTAAGHAIVQGLSNALRGALGLATSAGRAIETGIKGVFSGASGWLYAAGRAIVQGLVNGIESMIGTAVGAVERLSSLAQKAFGLLNKLHSPSKVYEGYGRQIVQGLALGITRNAGLVANALGSLGGPVPGVGVAQPAALYAGGGAVEVNVYIGEQELRGLVRTEIVDSNSGLARTLLAGNRR
jgi:phage-related protein